MADTTAAATTTATADTGTATAAASGTATAATTTAAAATTTTAADWTSGITDETAKNWVTAKGFKDPTSLATSALNLEKLTGDLNSIVKLPKGDDAAAWNQVYDRLGRPAAPADYKLPVPEGASADFANTASSWFHELGLSTKQGQALAAKWNEHLSGAMKAQGDATAAAHQQQIDALKVEWGGAMQANSAIVDNAATAFGMTTEHLNALKSAMGPAAAMKFLHAIGSKLGTEPGFVGGSQPGGFAAMTPAQAKAEISTLRGDKAFVQRYASGDAEAKAQMMRLHKFAYPEG